jgi:hypothetical protein
MPKAKLLYRSRLVYPDGAIREMVIWRLPESRVERQHGLKYRLYYGDAEGKCMIRYDNETGKGDHRHYCDKEEPYHFINVETLVADFQREINKLRRDK